jgi:hypothetical protein
MDISIDKQAALRGPGDRSLRDGENCLCPRVHAWAQRPQAPSMRPAALLPPPHRVADELADEMRQFCTMVRQADGGSLRV